MPRRRAPDRPADRIAAAARIACLLDAIAPKPGNVSRGRDLPGLSYRDLVRSAAAIGPAFRRFSEGRVGRLILEAVRATRRQVGSNTNLGIVLLLAPLARAAGATPGGTLHARLRRALAGLDVRDARDAYRAIRLAEPGGLGRVRDQDVAAEPTVSLLQAMRRASARDAIAREYATGFRTTFQVGLPTLQRLRDGHVPLTVAIAQTYLTLLAAQPDTLIARKHGLPAARRVSRAARDILRAGGLLTQKGRRMAERLDRRLRSRRPPLNPGATADLTVAALFVWLLQADETGPREPVRSSSRQRLPLRG